MSLKQFQDDLSRAAHGMTKDEALKAWICIECRKPPTWSGEPGRREYLISGLCEPCFNAICGIEGEIS